MDSKSTNISLIQHRLVSIHAENHIDPQAGKGGTVHFVVTVEAPDDKEILKLNDDFSLSIILECTGKNKEDGEIAFVARCKTEGRFRVFKCNKLGIKTTDNDQLWELAASMLMPLVASYVSDTVVKMNFKNIVVPPYLPMGTKKKIK